jgi:DNA-directed RNA polymerase subunit RPC12/RpoP
MAVGLHLSVKIKEKEDWRMADIFSAVQVGDEVVCRDCLRMEEMISAQRGITDSYSADDVRETEYTCSRCNKKIEPFEIKF